MIAQLRQRLGAGLPALVMTGDIAPERLTQLDAAAQPWLPKPLMPMRLRSWLNGLAHRPDAAPQPAASTARH